MLQSLDKKVLFSGLVLAVALLILASAFKNGKPTCNRFIFNTYAYVAFMTVWVVACSLYLIDYVKTNKSSAANQSNTPESSKTSKSAMLLLSPLNLVILFFFSLYLLYRTMVLPAYKPLQKHIMALLWLTTFSVFLIPLTERIQRTNTDALAQLTTIFFSIIGSATAVAVLLPSLIKSWWIFPLMIGLFGVIIARLIFGIIGLPMSSPEQKGLSYFVIILFTFFVSYDTRVAMQASKICREGQADYILFSTNLFLDFINIFSNLFNVSD